MGNRIASGRIAVGFLVLIVATSWLGIGISSAAARSCSGPIEDCPVAPGIGLRDLDLARSVCTIEDGSCPIVCWPGFEVAAAFVGIGGVELVCDEIGQTTAGCSTSDGFCFGASNANVVELSIGTCTATGIGTGVCFSPYAAIAVAGRMEARDAL
jgi:hypothetical protein